jgi:VacB/RNase II family 3'-5' exoribonuclease
MANPPDEAIGVSDRQHRSILRGIARRAMLDHGLLPDFSDEVLAELGRLQQSAAGSGGTAPGNAEIRDLRSLLWASIDNDDSLDLDQLSVAQVLPGDKVKIMIAIADVDTLVKRGSAIDERARHNTTSVYTAAQIFPMLPEALCNGLTSLNAGSERLAIVIEMVVDAQGMVHDSDIRRAQVTNHAKLAYNSVAAWLDGKAGMPPAVGAVPGLQGILRLQDQTAQRMKNFRYTQGAFSLETIEARPIFEGDQIRALENGKTNRAKEIIEDFMVAANGVAARFLTSRGMPSIRRVVRTPGRWERIVEIAGEHRFSLPEQANAKALEQFLIKEKAADPLRFSDLSLAVIKLLGPGEYVAEPPEGIAPGHFGLAVRDYAHATAPNRRYPDLLTQRLLKATLEGRPVPYSMDELAVLAAHCTAAEDAANKVERQVGKSAAALLLESRIGEQFAAIVTGASEKGTWVRLLTIPVEGALVQGFEGLDVGHRLQVRLVSVDVQRGFIDFTNCD